MFRHHYDGLIFLKLSDESISIALAFHTLRTPLLVLTGSPVGISCSVSDMLLFREV
jgi:hypothetical protein